MAAKAAPAPEFIETPPPNYVADITRAQPVGRTKFERGAIAKLEERRSYLLAQLDAGPPASGGAVHHMRQEAAALLWALRRIAELENAEREHPAWLRRILGAFTRHGDGPQAKADTLDRVLAAVGVAYDELPQVP